MKTNSNQFFSFLWSIVAVNYILDYNWFFCTASPTACALLHLRLINTSTKCLVHNQRIVVSESVTPCWLSVLIDELWFHHWLPFTDASHNLLFSLTFRSHLFAVYKVFDEFQYTLLKTCYPQKVLLISPMICHAGRSQKYSASCTLSTLSQVNVKSCVVQLRFNVLHTCTYIYLN